MKEEISSSTFLTASCFSCAPQKHLSCMTVLAPSLGQRQGSILLPWDTTGLQPLWRDPDHIMLPLHKTVALDFHCYQLERGEEVRHSATVGIFGLVIDAPAVKDRWQSAEQHLGVSRTRREKNQVSTQLVVSYSHFPIFTLSPQQITFPFCAFFK